MGVGLGVGDGDGIGVGEGVGVGAGEGVGIGVGVGSAVHPPVQIARGVMCPPAPEVSWNFTQHAAFVGDACTHSHLIVPSQPGMECHNPVDGSLDNVQTLVPSGQVSRARVKGQLAQAQGSVVERDSGACAATIAAFSRARERESGAGSRGWRSWAWALAGIGFETVCYDHGSLVHRNVDHAAPPNQIPRQGTTPRRGKGVGRREVTGGTSHPPTPLG